MSMFPVKVGGSFVGAFAEAQVENRKDSRAMAQAATEIEISGQRMQQIQRDRAVQEKRTQLAASAVQSGVSGVKSAAGHAQKTADTMQKTEATGRIETAMQADRAAGGDDHQALSDVRINEEQTLGERFSEAQIDAVLEGDFASPEELQAAAAEADPDNPLSDEEAETLAKAALQRLGFSDEEAEALFEMKESGGGISAEEAASFFYDNRFEPPTEANPAGSRLYRENRAAEQRERIGSQMLDLVSNTTKGLAEGRGHRAMDAQREGQRVGLAAELADAAEATARQGRGQDTQALTEAMKALLVRSDFEA